MTKRFLAAKKFFREAHDSINQARRYTGLRYWTHTEAVCDIVSTVTSDEDIRIIALGHDCIEDVFPVNGKYNLKEIQDRFGLRVCEGIIGLTEVYTKESFPHLNRAARKDLEKLRLSSKNSDVKLVKIADLIHNTSDIVENDRGFAITYLKEKASLLPVLKVESDPANVILWDIANEQLQEFIEELDVRL